MKKSVCVPALLLAAVCLLCGCTSREEKLAAAREAARLVRTNVTVDEDGNRVRKSTKYSSKHKK